MPRWSGSFIERLEEKYIPEPNSGCWLWIGAQTTHGYGHMRSPKLGTTVKAHRLVYETFVGQIPTGMQLDHLCRTPSCVNPAHLEPVTNKENSRRGIAGLVNGRRERAKTRCPRGHPYTQQNTYVDSRGSRSCRICRKISEQNRGLRRKAMRSSSNIAGSSYDDERSVLTITFSSGGEYEYLNCPREYYEGLESSPSPGSYFHRNIKDRFQTVRIA